MRTISPADARYLALSRQMLLDENNGNTKKDLLKIIERLGYVQIDTISIVERAHKHILWTRMPAFKTEMLDELIDKDKKVFEFWDHAASYLPMKNYRYLLSRKAGFKERHTPYAKKNKKLLAYIMDRIKNEGALMSRDFEEPKKRGLWWDWKPAKDALEYLFHSGELMVKARKNFQKVYDLPERILPRKIDTSMPAEEELSSHIILKTIEANGFASVKEMTYLRRHTPAATKKVLNELEEMKKIVRLKIGGVEDETYYSTSKNLKLLKNKTESKKLHILSPFDNLVIQRKRLKTLFGFDYTIECYVPAPKRKFGYFTMPVLYGDKMIGRIDTKAHRQENRFIILNAWWEKGTRLNKELKTEMNKELNRLGRFAGANILDKPF